MVSSVVVAPWGGPGGNSWIFTIPDSARLTEIDGRSGDAIDAIGFTYTDASGTYSKKYGGTGGGPFKISFGEEEVLIGISGTVGVFHNLTLVTSLSFQTNEKTYGPYGKDGGNSFSLLVVEGKFTGFSGKSGVLLDSFGVILQP